MPVSYHRRIGVSKVAGTVSGSLRAGWCILSTTFRYWRWVPTVEPGGRGAMTDVLYVAARAPRPGFTKTRLGQSIGNGPASLLYAAFLRDLSARLAQMPFAVGWYVTPEDAWDDLAPLVRPDRPETRRPRAPVRCWCRARVAGRRASRRCFREAPARGESRTVLIASDSPHLDVGAIVEAFGLLTSHDLVLGPTIDGGYYLIGMRGPWEVLGAVTMSTGTVLAEIVARAELLGLTVAFVPATFDVDEAHDLELLAEVVVQRRDLPATRAALEMLGRLSAVDAAGSATLLAMPVLERVPAPIAGRHDDDGAAS